MPRPLISTVISLALLAPASALAAQAAPAPAQMASPAQFDRFTPAPDGRETVLDFAMWTKALDFFVLEMGPSLRELAPRVLPGSGTRMVYGHTSKYRMEGNRVVFSLLEDDVKQSLTDYRLDLERIGTQIDLAKLPRNEQLAYWINLHNVAVIEQIATHYPVTQPRDIEIGGAPLDQARFITVAGVKLSPQDIRTRIVYPNWNDPRVIYGFFRGEIGGPSLPSMAYTGTDVGRMLDDAATEFVNALRGVQKSGDRLLVSEIYEEARPYYFGNWPTDLRTHLADYAEEEVNSILGNTGNRVEASLYEADIADLAKGEREPQYSYVERCTGDYIETCTLPPVRIPPNVQRVTDERKVKINRLIKEGRLGRVILENEDGEQIGAEVE